MDLEITVGPSHLALHQGNNVLISEQDGQISWPTDKGLYFFDTRLISSWSIYANGETWELLNSGNITHYASRVFLTNRAITTEDGDIPQRSLGFVIGRSLSGGVHEDLDIVNHRMKPRLIAGDAEARFAWTVPRMAPDTVDASATISSRNIAGERETALRRLRARAESTGQQNKENNR